MIDLFRLIRDEKRERFSANAIKNLRIIREAGIPFVIAKTPNTLLFRVEGEPKVDFYLPSGKWKYVPFKGKPQYLHGGAESFVNWYKKKVTYANN